jgi:hypothetical protein
MRHLFTLEVITRISFTWPLKIVSLIFSNFYKQLAFSLNVIPTINPAWNGSYQTIFCFVGQNLCKNVFWSSRRKTKMKWMVSLGGSLWFEQILLLTLFQQIEQLFKMIKRVINSIKLILIVTINCGSSIMKLCESFLPLNLHIPTKITPECCHEKLQKSKKIRI